MLLGDKGVSDPVYIREEIERLASADKETLMAIHNIKKVFENAKVEAVDIIEEPPTPHVPQTPLKNRRAEEQGKLL